MDVKNCSMETHTGEKPFNCIVCDFKCFRINHLKQHMTTHTTEQPIQCADCDYKCNHKEELIIHFRTHTGKIPLSCKVIDNKSHRKSSKDILRKSLTLLQKVDIIREYTQGKTNLELSKKYNVHHATISKITKNKDNIMKNYKMVMEVDGNPNVRRFRDPNLPILEELVFNWFKQKRSIGEPVSGILLREKAKHFFLKLKNEEKILPNHSEFNASCGWMDKFKKRHGLHIIQTKGEKASADIQASKNFQVDFSEFVEENQYEPDDMYNADELALYFRSLPEKTLVLPGETEVAGHTMIKERVTILACANASGTDRIPLLVIGKSKRPLCFKNVTEFPLEYRNQRSAWMNTDIFLDYYKNIFLPHIVKRKPNGRFVLLLDNAPTHPSADQLNAIDSRCVVMYLPPNVTSLQQPMDQGPISALKRRYKTGFLRELLSCETKCKEDMVQFVKKWNLFKCMNILKESWNALTQETLANGWKNLLGSSKFQSEESQRQNVHMLELLNRVPGGGKYTSREVQTWVSEDDFTPVFRVLNDDELLNVVVHGVVPKEDEVAVVNTSSDEEVEDENPNPPSLKTIFHAAQHVLSWVRGCNDFTEQESATVIKVRDAIFDKYSEINR